MWYSKKAGRLIIIYSLAAVLVMGGFLWRSETEKTALRRTVAVGYDRAFVELADAVGALDASLQKTLCAATPTMVSDLCSQGYAHCAAASQAIESLPYGNIELEHTAAFLARTGDYLAYLSRMGARGSGLSGEARQALSELSGSAGTVSDTLSGLAAMLISGQISTAELEKAEAVIASAEDSMVDVGFADSFKDMETDLPEMPSLIYDGPFSQHIDTMEPRLLEGLAEIGEDEALAAAARFLGVEAKRLRVLCLREEKALPVYVLTCQSGGEIETVEVTKRGGKVVFYGTARETSEGEIAPEAAVKTAQRFLESHGYDGMEPTYHTAEGGELLATFAYAQDGVICYPDLIKVTVALDTGRVTGMEARGYVMNHTRREPARAAFDTDAAVSRLSPTLTVESHRPAVIPTAGKNEVLCEEYLCRTEEGGHVLVYLNAGTGDEEKILLLLESDSGTLTL